MDRSAIDEAIRKLSEERDRLDNERAKIDEALAVLRPLAGDPSPPSNGADVKNGHAAPRGQMAVMLKTLGKVGEPLTAKSVHLALGKRAPTHQTTTNKLLRQAHESGYAKRHGTEKPYRYSVA